MMCQNPPISPAPLSLHTTCTSFSTYYIMVQLTVHVSVSGLPVLTILYRLIRMHKMTKSQNCDFFFLIVALKKTLFYIFLIFGQFHQKRGLIGQKQN